MITTASTRHVAMGMHTLNGDPRHRQFVLDSAKLHLFTCAPFCSKKPRKRYVYDDWVKNFMMPEFSGIIGSYMTLNRRS